VVVAVIFARIRVADFARWRRAFAESEPIRREHGITTRELYRDATYHDGLIVVLDAEDVGRAQAFYNSADQRQRMVSSGMERPAEMWMGSPLPASDDPAP
jgi:hypothetical protein